MRIINKGRVIKTKRGAKKRRRFRQEDVKEILRIIDFMFIIFFVGVIGCLVAFMVVLYISVIAPNEDHFKWYLSFYLPIGVILSYETYAFIKIWKMKIN